MFTVGRPDRGIDLSALDHGRVHASPPTCLGGCRSACTARFDPWWRLPRNAAHSGRQSGNAHLGAHQWCMRRWCSKIYSGPPPSTDRASRNPSSSSSTCPDPDRLPVPRPGRWRPRARPGARAAGDRGQSPMRAQARGSAFLLALFRRPTIVARCASFRVPEFPGCRADAGSAGGPPCCALSAGAL